MSELRNYVIAGLLWDPQRSGKALISEFLDLHYAEAAEPIRRYIARIHEKARASGKHHNCFGNLSDYGLDASDAQAALDAFAQAMQLAQSDAVEARVERASICAYRAAIEPVWYKKHGPLDPELARRTRPLVKRFFELCEKHHVDRPRETREDTQAAKHRLLAVFGVDAF